MHWCKACGKLWAPPDGIPLAWPEPWEVLHHGLRHHFGFQHSEPHPARATRTLSGHKVFLICNTLTIAAPGAGGVHAAIHAAAVAGADAVDGGAAAGAARVAARARAWSGSYTLLPLPTNSGGLMHVAHWSA